MFRFTPFGDIQAYFHLPLASPKVIQMMPFRAAKQYHETVPH
jgi:hypothetical protein